MAGPGAAERHTAAPDPPPAGADGDGGHGDGDGLTEHEREGVRRALRTPRGRYPAERASQLAGVPVRTLHDWAVTGVLVPDGMAVRPRSWSYRDVVFARMVAWLRGKGMPRRQAAAQVAGVRRLMAIDPSAPAGDPGPVRSDGRVVLAGAGAVDPLSGQQVFAELTTFLDAFDLTAPVAELAGGPTWGPNLVRPSAHTRLSPWVVAGEPCVVGTRVATAALHGLHVERDLDVAAIAALYPGLVDAQVADALALERRLRAGPGDDRHRRQAGGRRGHAGAAAA